MNELVRMAAQEANSMTSLYQVMLMVSDVDRMIRFYRDMVGLPVIFPKDEPDGGFSDWVVLDAKGTRLAIHGTDEVEPGGTATLSFSVDDVEAVYLDLKNRGCYIELPMELGPGVFVSKAVDPEGNHLSFDQAQVRPRAAFIWGIWVSGSCGGLIGRLVWPRGRIVVRPYGVVDRTISACVTAVPARTKAPPG
jgi:predicted enzyme related to lactoylglutathione lyase